MDIDQVDGYSMLLVAINRMKTDICEGCQTLRRISIKTNKETNTIAKAMENTSIKYIIKYSDIGLKF